MSDKEVKTTSMRIGSDVTEQAKIAAALKGISMLEYVSQVVLASAARDIEEFRRGGASQPAKARKNRDN